MAINFGGGVTVISSFWTQFKATVIAKSLSMQYQDDGNITTVFAFDSTTLVYTAIMWDGGNVPNGIQAAYSVAQNNSDLSDFQTNWQSSANQPTEIITATGTLGALNNTVQLSIANAQSVGVQVAVGTLIGTIIAETSFDNGATWNQTIFVYAGNTSLFSKSFSITYASSPNGAQAASIVVNGGAGLVRVRVFAYTSGSCNVVMTASGIGDETIDLFTAQAGYPLPPLLAVTAGAVTTGAPSYTTSTINALSLNASGGLRTDGSGVTQPVSGTIAGTQSGTWTVQPGNTANTTPWLATINQGGNSAAVAAKGTQGSNALAVQDLKDSGRVSFVAAALAATGVTTEALISLTPVRTVTAGTAGVSLTVTAGKTLRITAISVTVRNTAATQCSVVCRVRMNSTTVTATSQLIFTCGTAALTAVSGSTNNETFVIPDGFEISGTTQFGITQLASATTCTVDVTLIGFEY
jgi:hypothetical protein